MSCIFVTKTEALWIYCYSLFPKLILEGKDKFQLQVNEHVDEFSLLPN